MKILLSGVPGTGKTTIGEYFAKTHAFYHQDMEENSFEPVRRLKTDSSNFLKSLGSHENVMVTWGFGPFTDRSMVDLLTQSGFLLFWLDGDRISSFRSFMHREKHNDAMEFLYYQQVTFIVATKIVEQLQPSIINPFTRAATRPPPSKPRANELPHAAPSNYVKHLRVLFVYFMVLYTSSGTHPRHFCNRKVQNGQQLACSGSLQ